MKKLIEKDLSYKLTGICYRIHNELGRFLTEKQYSDAFADELVKENISFKREPYLKVDETTIKIGRPDFVIEDRIIVDLKAKKFITKEDYNQMQKYLSLMSKELGLIINFQSPFLKPKRVLNYKLHSEHSDADSDH